MMKKSLVALAALAVAGIASAQSSVTLFGVVDAGISYFDAKSVNNTTGATVKQSQWAQTASGYNTSRLGFRGTEDLGGGLAASFWLEAGLGNDTGAAGGPAGQLFNRRSTVSLSGGFGEVRIGRDYVSTFWNDTVFDPFGTSGSGTNLIFQTHTNQIVRNGVVSAFADAQYIRANNMVAYFLPSNLGGFYGQLQYAFPEGVKNVAAVAPAVNNSKATQYEGGRFGYANGPLDVALAYGQSTVADNGLGATGKAKTANLGASYDFNVVKAMAEISQVKDVGVAPGFADSTLNRKGYLIGLTAPVGPGLIRASFAQTKDSGNYLNGFGTPKASQLALGYVHNLSKRTALYATIAHITNKGGSADNMSSTTGSPVGAAATFAGTTPGSANGYDFGIRHAF